MAYPRQEPTSWLAAAMAALMDADVVGVVLGERDDIVDADGEFLRILGIGRSRLDSGLTWQEISPDADRDAGAWAELVRTGGSVAVQELRCPDGPEDARVPVLVASAAVPGTDRWVCVVVDLSEDERLRRLASAEAAIVSTLLDDAPIGFALIDPEMRFIRVNRELAAMNGLPAADHLGVGAFDIVPDLREAAEPLLRGVLDTGEPVRDVEITGETLADPGVPHTWSESFFPIRTPHGSVLGVAAVARDVTEVRRLQGQLAATADRQRQALEDLQTSLLPTLAPVHGVDVAARYLAAGEDVRVGGDWYDAVVAPDGRLVLSVGDAVGHGLPAVGFMARASAAVRAFVSEGHGPAAVLDRLNRLLLTPESEGLASAVVVALDTATGAAEFACAGHPYAMVRAPGRPVVQLVDAQGPLLGTRDGAYPTARTTLPPGGALLLYTDGLVERRAESLTDGLERLVRVLEAEPPADAAATLVGAALAACLPDGVRDDDVCLLAAVRRPA